MSEDELTKKERKSFRKIASKTDRSKFKKTDQKKWATKKGLAHEKKIAKLHLEEGRVLAIRPEEMIVATATGEVHCSLGGVLKQEYTQHKNIVTVGDIVSFDSQSYRIVSVHPRKTILSRQDHLRRRKEQLIASNIDQVLITVSVVSPPLKPALIDRYLIATLKGGMQPVIVINKIDLLKKGSEEDLLYQDVIALYQELQIPVIGVSVLKNKGMSKLKKIMEGKASVFSGQSGVGKSSLINSVAKTQLPTQQLRKGEKGAHTTTHASLIPLSFGGWCIDTPGIRSFGVWNLTEEDLKTYYPEIVALGNHCHYPNCTHTHEPKCHVLNSLKAGKLSPLRYLSYLKLRDELTLT